MSTAKIDNEPAAGVYAPRRSQRVSSDLAPSDGDIWQEKLAVCEGAAPNGEPRLLIRSFYRNGRTRERVWDEPPSGAGTVLHATSDMRKTAEIQKQGLQLTLEMIPPEQEDDMDSSPSGESSEKKKKKGLLGRFKKKKKERKQVDTAKDLNLQRAIARSMADQRAGGDPNEPVVYYDGESTDNFATGGEDDEEIALAKALSMSAAEVEQQYATALAPSTSLTEEEMFQRALEKSKEDSRTSAAAGVASMPDGHNSFNSFSTSSPVSHPNGFVGKSDPNEDLLDAKLPALSLEDEKPASKFDPYG